MTVHSEYYEETNKRYWIFISDHCRVQAVLNPGWNGVKFFRGFVEPAHRGKGKYTIFKKKVEAYLYFECKVKTFYTGRGSNDSFHLKRGYEVLDEKYLIKRL